MSKGFADPIVVAVKLEAYDGHGDMTRGDKPQEASRKTEAKALGIIARCENNRHCC